MNFFSINRWKDGGEDGKWEIATIQMKDGGVIGETIFESF